ncbi:hypothetical protein U0070_006110 [Myodes glareolus]|uniref:Uncharacterized protein n=1 Tax=Myodes glareolus TaxID=447135 RepID=A0AAW0HA92_MYOGA
MVVMASTSARNGEKKDSWPSQAAAALGGGQVNNHGMIQGLPSQPANTSLEDTGPKVSLSRSEEFLTQISTELTDEALFIARSHVNSVPIKETMQTKDQGTQISARHVVFTKTRGTDTRTDRNRTRSKAHLLPSPRSTSQQPDNWRMSPPPCAALLASPSPTLLLSESLNAPPLQLAKHLISGGTPARQQCHL